MRRNTALIAVAAALPGLLFVTRPFAGETPPKNAATASPTTPVAADGAQKEKDEDAGSKVSEFMRKKLSASQEVLEGLMTDDFALIASGAKTMEAMSHASDWQVLEGPVYKLMSSDFRKTCEELADAAKKENIDRASLAYMRLTMNCISCHGFVRRTMVAEHRIPSLDDRTISAR